MSYNLTFLDNVNNPLDLATGVNTASSGFLFGLLLFFFWFIMFISLGKYTISQRLLASSFLTSLGGGFLLATGLVEWWVLVFPAVATFIGIILLIWGGE